VIAGKSCIVRGPDSNVRPFFMPVRRLPKMTSRVTMGVSERKDRLMRALILKIVDVAALAMVVVATLAGFLSGLALTFDDRAPMVTRLLSPILMPAIAFIAAALVAGGIVALLEIVKNTRRTVELLERISVK
jgi:hypothetical protein